ncbi:MAG TPA: alpha/beta hydrolase [Nevskiaceae bacterium]|nr:alpha/beta hydrolase [Nevskiaceae bacterium]
MDDIPLIDPPVQAMTLADGRRLTWQEFGASAGNPVLYFHGGGSYSLEAGIFHREAVRKNIRLIATNRPGTAGSSLRPGRLVAAYSDDLRELLDHLNIGKFACLGESNGGLVTMAVAATMPDRILGAMPINPTVPWFDPVARTVSSKAVAWGYRLMKWWPALLIRAAPLGVAHARRRRSEAGEGNGMFDPRDLAGPPPGTEPDIAELHWQVMEQSPKHASLMPELVWASSNWGFDYYSIPVPLDFFCGVHDAQAPFALVLADRNPDARFHYFSFGHHGYSHPDARRRIFDQVASYFAA